MTTGKPPWTGTERPASPPIRSVAMQCVGGLIAAERRCPVHLAWTPPAMVEHMQVFHVE